MQKSVLLRTDLLKNISFVKLCNFYICKYILFTLGQYVPKCKEKTYNSMFVKL